MGYYWLLSVMWCDLWFRSQLSAITCGSLLGYGVQLYKLPQHELYMYLVLDAHSQDATKREVPTLATCSDSHEQQY